MPPRGHVKSAGQRAPAMHRTLPDSEGVCCPALIGGTRPSRAMLASAVLRLGVCALPALDEVLALETILFFLSQQPGNGTVASARQIGDNTFTGAARCSLTVSSALGEPMVITKSRKRPPDRKPGPQPLQRLRPPPRGHGLFDRSSVESRWLQFFSELEFQHDIATSFTEEVAKLDPYCSTARQCPWGQLYAPFPSPLQHYPSLLYFFMGAMGRYLSAAACLPNQFRVLQVAVHRMMPDFSLGFSPVSGETLAFIDFHWFDI